MIYKDKDITTVTQGIVAHGVNCQGVMGGGVALAIRRKWPKIYEDYMSIKVKQLEHFGTAQVVIIEEDLYVANCFTQKFFGRGGIFAEAAAVKSSLYQVFMLASGLKLDVYIPKIGSGLGGLNWERDVVPLVEELEKTFPTINCYVYVFGE
jgi:O-acetyl-ADP-ribose deacetylase (regulator of RNase III)